MKATKSLVGILAIIAIAMVGITFGLYWYEPEVTSDFTEGSLLIQGINPETVQKLEVKKGGDTLTLVRNDEGFVVADKFNYPAKTSAVNELFVKVLDIRCQTKQTDDASNHEELGVGSEKPEEGSITMYGDDDKVIAKVLVGKNPEHGEGPYVRLDGKNRVYVAEKSLWFGASANSYMETKVLDISKDKVSQVDVKSPNGTYTILNKDDKGDLQGVPAGKKAKQTEVDQVFGALSYFSFTDVIPVKDSGITWDASYTCKLKKHLAYTLNLGKKGTKSYVRITAAGPSQQVLQKNVTEVNQKLQSGQKLSDAELKQKDEILSASQEAADINKAHSSWAYEIAEWKAKNLQKPFDELVEDDNPEDPKEIAASHILIAYKGADRADASITRTKEEAKKRADELLAKLKAPGADFAALAKENSDGPSGPKGGDLGTFGKGSMAKPFEEAAWKLKVGEISGVVETGFGYHIIKRTK